MELMRAMQDLGRSMVVSVIAMGVAAVVFAAPLRAAPIDASSLLRAGKYQELDAYFNAVQRNFAAGTLSGDELRNEFRAFYPTARDLEQKLDGWVQAFPQSYAARLARGIYFKRVGLEERGGEYISKTSRQQLGNMDSALEKAIRDFGTSIPMEKKPFLSYLHMMDISSQYVGVAYTRQLYDKAVALSASSFGLRLKLMRSLGAKWGGGLQMMEAFMTECRLAHLPDSQLNQLQAMVYEDEGWEDVNYRNDLAGAEVAYRKALEQVPGECESCVHPDVGLILVLMKLGKFPDAIEYLDAYLRAHPDDLWGLANRGESYMESGNGRSAIADWSRAANAGDDYSQYHLGVAYLQGVPGVLAPDKNAGGDWLRKSADQGNLDAIRVLQEGSDPLPPAAP